MVGDGGGDKKMIIAQPTDFNEKERLLLRWISRTVGGLMPIESQEKRTAIALEKRGFIKLIRQNGLLKGHFTEKGRATLRTWGWM
jgi:hypothetical protein